jgi:hypothetical protein
MTGGFCRGGWEQTLFQRLNQLKFADRLGYCRKCRELHEGVHKFAWLFSQSATYLLFAYVASVFEDDSMFELQNTIRDGA